MGFGTATAEHVRRNVFKQLWEAGEQRPASLLPPQGLAIVGKGSCGLRSKGCLQQKRQRCHLGRLWNGSPWLFLGEGLHRSLCPDWRQVGSDRKTRSFSGRAVAPGTGPPLSTAGRRTSASRPYGEGNVYLSSPKEECSLGAAATSPPRSRHPRSRHPRSPLRPPPRAALGSPGPLCPSPAPLPLKRGTRRRRRPPPPRLKNSHPTGASRGRLPPSPAGRPRPPAGPLSASGAAPPSACRTALLPPGSSPGDAVSPAAPPAPTLGRGRRRLRPAGGTVRRAG